MKGMVGESRGSEKGREGKERDGEGGMREGKGEEWKV